MVCLLVHWKPQAERRSAIAAVNVGEGISNVEKKDKSGIGDDKSVQGMCLVMMIVALSLLTLAG